MAEELLAIADALLNPKKKLTSATKKKIEAINKIKEKPVEKTPAEKEAERQKEYKNLRRRHLSFVKYHQKFAEESEKAAIRSKHAKAAQYHDYAADLYKRILNGQKFLLPNAKDATKKADRVTYEALNPPVKKAPISKNDYGSYGGGCGSYGGGCHQ